MQRYYKKSYFKIHTFLFLVYAICVSFPVWSSDSVQVNDSLSFLSVSAMTEYYQDTSGTMIFSEIQNLSSSSFKQLNHDRYSLGLFNDILWIRFRIEKKGDKRALLSITKLMPYIDIYIPEKNNSGFEYRHLEAGNFNNTKRIFPYRYPVFPIPDKISAEEYIYIRIQPFSRSDHVSLDFTIELQNEHTFYLKAISEVAVMFFLIGGLIALGVYNLVLALYLKIKIYGYYVAYIFSMILFLILRSRILGIFGVYRIHLLVLPVIMITYFLSIVFSRFFLESKENLPRLDKLMLFILFLSPFTLIFLLIGMPVVSDIIIHVLTVAAPLLVIIAGFTRYRQGYAPARFYFGAWLILGSAVLLSGLGSGGWGIIPSFIDLEYFIAIGAFGEALLLSLALADRINILQQEKTYFENREKHLSEISLRDELTGLYNKRMYYRTIQRSIESSRKNNIPLSLLILDIDHFKSVNDDFGHLVGDKLLKEIADCFIFCLRTRDISCRYGGEEFAIILPETSVSGAMIIAERLREQSAKASVVESSGKKVCRTVSIGVSELADNETGEDLFERADRALYAAKEGGRNMVVQLNQDK